MCHSVEIYLPQMARAAAEQWVGSAGRVSVLAGLVRLLKLEKVPNALKNNDLQFESGLRLTERELHGRKCQARAGA